MAIAPRVKWYLDVHRVGYEVIMHPYTETSRETAEIAGVPKRKLAKGVLLEDERGYVMPVLPASARLDLDALNRFLGRNLRMSSTDDLACLFFDCEDGALPPMGAAYGIPTIIDDSLLDMGDVYFEGGDHVDLVHMGCDEFFSLVPDSLHAPFSRPVN